MPALRQRRDDLPELIDLFLEDVSAKNQLSAPEVTKEAFNILYKYDWPGNVRQLRNIIQRLIVLNNNSLISSEEVEAALGSDIKMQTTQTEFPNYFDNEMRQAKEQFEISYLSYQLDKVNGNVSALAKNIGLERTHLYRKLKSLNITAKNAK